MRGRDGAGRRLDWRWIVCGLIAVTGAAAMLIRVSTTLGVKVPETNVPGLDPSFIDTSGSERIWRVWARAHGDLIGVSPAGILSAGLLILLAIFAGALLLAIWIALTPEQQESVQAE